MGLSSSILSFPDIKKYLDDAIDSENGTRIHFATHNEALAFRHRCNWFRSLDRKENMVLYPLGHQMYGRSIYDTLMLKVRPQKPDPAEPNYVLLEKVKITALKTEAL